ncbi:MAG TPA: hypothetical protein QF646_04145 [Candidatus Poseidoniales archaeon]|nr:hypothetical protein [Candidatus Poseidoniales archaeon]
MVLVVLLLTSVFPFVTHLDDVDSFSPTHILAPEPAHASTIFDYILYLDSPRTGADGDGHLTTVEPEGSDSEEADAAEEEGLEFRTDELDAPLTMHGEWQSSSNRYGIESYIFLRHRGSNSTADYLFSLQIEDDGGATEIGVATQDVEGCPAWQTNCGYSTYPIRLKFDAGISEVVIPAGSRLLLRVSADTTCEGGGGGSIPSLPADCTAQVAWGDIDGSTEYSKMGVRTHALETSSISLYRDDSFYRYKEQVSQVYPNDDLEYRKLFLSLDIRSAFGVADLRRVEISLYNAEAGKDLIPSEHRIVDLDTLASQGRSLIYEFNWTYGSNEDVGYYTLTALIRDQRDHQVTIQRTYSNSAVDHPLTVTEHGVRASMTNTSTDIIHIPPGSFTSFGVRLRHVGDLSLTQTVRVEALTQFGSDWTVSVPADEITLDSSQSSVTREVTLTTPDDLGTMPADGKFRLRFDVYVDDSKVDEVWGNWTMQKVDVHAAPVVTLYHDAEFTQPFYNSTRPDEDNLLANPLPIEAGNTSTIHMRIFNAGYDSDPFKIGQIQKPSWANLEFFDSEAGSELPADDSSIGYSVRELGRFESIEIRIRIEALSVESNVLIDDLGFTVSNADNLTYESLIGLQLQRTYGMFATVEWDNDADSPVGNVTGITAGDSSSVAEFRIRATSVRTDDLDVDWNFIRIEDIAANRDGDDDLTQWDFEYLDASMSEPFDFPLRLSSGSSEEFAVRMRPDSLARAGEHNVVLRFEQADDPTREFELQVVVDVAIGMPQVRLIQGTANVEVMSGQGMDYEFEIRNDGNAMVIFEVEVEDIPIGWGVEVSPTYIPLDPSEGQTVSISVSTAECTRAGVTEQLTIVAKPTISILGETTTSYNRSQAYEEILEIKTTSPTGTDGLRCEIINPRAETLIFIGLGLLVLVASVARRGRGPAASAAVETVVDSEDTDFDQIEASIDEIEDL